jgi:hypothetical protein
MMPIGALVMSADGRYLLASAGPHIVLANATSRLVLASTRTTSESKPGALVRDVALFSVDAGALVRIACVSDDKRMYAYEWSSATAANGSSGSLRFVGSRQFKKRPITCAFAGAPDAVAVADRHGDAFLCDWSALRPDVTPEQDEFAADFGTLSSITALLPLPAGARRLAAANRDEQVFIVRVPEVYEIVAFCLGHEAFVTSLAYTTPAAAPHLTVLLSAGGDASVRAWNAITGAPLADFQIRPNHTPVATITGVEPILAPEFVIRSLAAFDNNVYYVTQNGAVFHILLAAGVDGAPLCFVGPPKLLVPANASCAVAVAQGVWLANNDGTIVLHASADGAVLGSIAGAAIPAESSEAAAAILKEIDPSLFQHQLDSNTRGRGAGGGGAGKDEQDDEDDD